MREGEGGQGLKHLGDITKIDGAKIPAVDVVTGGSPCQDLSVAGKRSGMSKTCPNCGWSAVGNAEESVCPECGTELEYTRSGLFMEQIRVMKEMREHDRRTGRSGIDVRCRYGIWENVPGALSSNKGADFQAVLTEFARVSVPNAPPVPMPDGGKWPKSGVFYDSMGRFSIAYRIHDAQYWGVPQRRRRLALVADFNGLTAAEILFDPQLRREAEDTEPDQAVADSGAQPRSEVQPECKSVSGHFESGEAQGQGTAAATESGTGSSSISFQERAGKPGGGKGILIQEERTGALSTLNIQSVLAGEAIPIEGNGQRESHRGNGYGNEGDPMFTLNSTEHHAVAAEAYGICSYDSNAMKSPNPNSGFYKADTSRTLDLNGGSPACNQGGVAVVEEVLPFDTTQVTSPYNGNNPHYGDPCHPLAAGAHPPSVAVTAGFKAGQSKDGGLGYEEEKAPTLSATPSALEPTVVCLNDQGGSVMGVSEEVTGALRAQEHGHQPLIAAGFCRGQSARTRGIGYQVEQAPTIPNGDIPCVMEAAAAGFSFGNSAKARSIGFQEEVSPTLRGGEGGNQKPCVLDATAMSDDVVTMNPRPQSMVCQHDMAATLGADDYKEPQMVFDARGNGDGKTVCTLTGDHQNRVTDYTAVVTSYQDTTGTLTPGGHPGSYNGQDAYTDMLVAAVDCRNATENPDVNGTLQAKEQGQNLNSNNVVRTGEQRGGGAYMSIVRRLTPLE